MAGRVTRVCRRHYRTSTGRQYMAPAAVALPWRRPDHRHPWRRRGWGGAGVIVSARRRPSDRRSSSSSIAVGRTQTHECRTAMPLSLHDDDGYATRTPLSARFPHILALVTSSKWFTIKYIIVCTVMFHLTKNGSLQRCSSQPISWLVQGKQNPIRTKQGTQNMLDKWRNTNVG